MKAILCGGLAGIAFCCATLIPVEVLTDASGDAWSVGLYAYAVICGWVGVAYFERRWSA